MFVVQTFEKYPKWRKNNKKVSLIEYFIETSYKPNVIDFLKYFIIDLIVNWGKEPEFDEYGVTIYVGDQGSGKSVSAVEYMERMKHKYKRLKTCTNLGYEKQDYELLLWNDFMKYSNGKDGMLFCWDEIHGDYNQNSWKDFPEELLSEISQQRKQKVKIICTAQNYGDIPIQIKRQCFWVVECNTFMKRWVFQKRFPKRTYEKILDNPDKKIKFNPSRYSFVQSNYIRSLYDTDRKIERMKEHGYKKRPTIKVYQ